MIVSVLPVAATANDFHCGTVAPAPCAFELSGTEELCGWVEMGTHDSVAVPTPAEAAEVDAVDSSMTAIAAAACASAGVSVEQIVEPFAMVGPFFDDSLASVERFRQWWAQALAAAQLLQEEDSAFHAQIAADVQAELDAIAAQEPLDVEPAGLAGLGPSVLVHVTPPAVADRLIGGSAIIVTLQESEARFDLTSRDLALGSVLPLRSHPFCIRRHAYASPLWDEVDDLTVNATVDQVAVADSQVQCGSADCHLEALIYRIETWMSEESPVWNAVEPRNIGHRFATLAVGGNRLVSEAAQLLASHWPESDQRIAPSPSGEALLARAGAIEAVSIEASDVQAETQIAELPMESNLR